MTPRTHNGPNEEGATAPPRPRGMGTDLHPGQLLLPKREGRHSSDCVSQPARLPRKGGGNL